jgi:hypothetical protein
VPLVICVIQRDGTGRHRGTRVTFASQGPSENRVVTMDAGSVIAIEEVFVLFIKLEGLAAVNGLYAFRAECVRDLR